MKIRKIDLVTGFRQSTPYINTHRNSVFVIMLDGEAIANNNFYNIVNDIGLLHSLGIRLVIVYGARPQIDAKLQADNIAAHYHKNIRVTDTLALEKVKQVAGQLQLDITARLSMSLNNTPLQGAHINVVSGNFIIAQPIGVDDGVDYCHSGRVRRIDTESIHLLLDNNAIVLLGPVAVSVTGESFNLCSEEIATQVAIKLQAEKMIGFCPTQGLLDQNNKVVAEIFPREMHYYIDDKTLADKKSMQTHRFIKQAIQACQNGVSRCHLISYCDDGALIQELFSRDGIGTQIVMASAEQIRQATIHDIGGILKLIRPLEEHGTLVKRSREQLEMEIDNFIIVELDKLAIACAALYTFPEDKMAEMACVAVHPDYRNSCRGDALLQQITHKAQRLGIRQLFVLTTRSIHWFQERGFVPANIDNLPLKKKALYNYQRNSKILIMDI